MLAEYTASAFMVSVVYVPILVHFSLDITPSLEEQVSAMFSLSNIFFSSS